MNIFYWHNLIGFIKASSFIIILSSIISCSEIQKTPSTFCHFEAKESWMYASDSTKTDGYYYHLEPAIECAEQTGKPILLVFTGWSVSSNNIAQLYENTQTKNLVRENFVEVHLYVDDKMKIDFGQKNYRGKDINTVGRMNAHFQFTHFNKLSQPYYAIVDKDMNKLCEPIGYVPKREKYRFIEFLKSGIKGFEKSK